MIVNRVLRFFGLQRIAPDAVILQNATIRGGIRIEADAPVRIVGMRVEP